MLLLEPTQFLRPALALPVLPLLLVQELLLLASVLASVLVLPLLALQAV